jgi:hypothetical protein
MRWAPRKCKCVARIGRPALMARAAGPVVGRRSSARCLLAHLMRIPELKKGPAALATATAVAMLASLLAARHQGVALAALWSAAMIASFVGWGSLVELWLTRDATGGAARPPVDWGLRAGWGMALFIVTGGFLCLVKLATRPFLVAHVGLGIVAWLVTWALRSRPRMSPTRLRRIATLAVGRSGTLLLVWLAYGLGVFTLFAFLGNHWFQPSDDAPFYFVLPENLVQTGSMFEPFAARRATSFGGHVYLHAAFLSVAPIYYIHAVDAGISTILVVALLVGYPGRGRFKAWYAAPIAMGVLVLFTLEQVRVNTASLVSGVVAIVTLFRTVRVPLGGPERPLWPIEPRRMVLLAALTMVCVLVRTSNAAAVLPFVGLVFASDYFLGARRAWTVESLRTLAVAAGIFIGTCVVVLLPWSILMKQSTGTFFFPFGAHNVTPGWTYLLHPSSLASEFAMHLFHGKPVALFIPFAAAGLVPLTGRSRNDVIALTVGSIIGLVAQAWQSAAFGPINTARYYFAYVAANAIIVAISAERATSRTALVGAAVAMHLTLTRDDTRDTMNEWIKSARSALGEQPKDRQAFDAVSADYADIQSHIPPGATIASAVYEPFRFDFKRNQIWLLDFLGGMGPKPGWPFKQGPEVLTKYLVACGVQYLVWVDFNIPHEFYNKAHWTTHLSKAGTYLQGEAVIQLDAEDSIEKLTATHRVVYRGHGMTVVDLTRSAD